MHDAGGARDFAAGRRVRSLGEISAHLQRRAILLRLVLHEALNVREGAARCTFHSVTCDSLASSVHCLASSEAFASFRQRLVCSQKQRASRSTQQARADRRICRAVTAWRLLEALQPGFQRRAGVLLRRGLLPAHAALQAVRYQLCAPNAVLRSSQSCCEKRRHDVAQHCTHPSPSVAQNFWCRASRPTVSNCSPPTGGFACGQLELA